LTAGDELGNRTAASQQLVNRGHEGGDHAA
jgi:hypothetical protein